MANYGFAAQKGKATPQSQVIPGRDADMTKNLAGGVSFKADKWTALRRWLLTGSMFDGYYQGKEEMTDANIKLLSELIAKDPSRVATEIIDASKKGISVHTPILALTFLSMGEGEAKNLFKSAFKDTVRTASHLYEFMNYVKNYRGKGSVIHSAMNRWLSDRSISDLEYQFLKYQSREGFSGRDILRLAKPKSDGTRSQLYNWITGGSKKNPLIPAEKLSDELQKIKIYETLKKGASESDVTAAIRTFGLTHEMIPSNIARTKAVWEALFEKMPVGATIRNLGNLTEKGVFKDKKYLDMLDQRFSPEALRKAYTHPIVLASALKVYEAGGTLGKSSLRWDRVPRVEDALSQAINDSFDVLEPTGKTFFYALDVSGSMGGGQVGNLWMTPFEIEGIMALASIKSEKDYFVGGFNTQFEPINSLRKSTSFKDARHFWKGGFGGTDASSAYDYAIKNNVYADVFVFFTDSESWAGRRHPSQALADYRSKINKNAKAIYVTLTAYGDHISLVDPKDPMSYDIAGFTAETPKLIQMIASGVL